MEATTMNIMYLREFAEVVLSMNMGKAAKALHVSQPSLSKHIAALERECKTTLLKRSTSRMQLTLAGQILYEESQKLIRIHDEMLAKIQGIKNVSTLRIGGLYNSATMVSLINRASAALNDEEIALLVFYQDYRRKSYVEMLQSDNIDLAFTILSKDDILDDTLERVFLFKDSMICLAKEDHPLARQNMIHIQDLANQTILQPTGSYSTEHGRSTVRNIFQKYGICPIEKPVFVHSISELSTIANNHCLLIMEQSMLSSQPFTNDYHELSFFEEDASFSFYAVFRKNSEDANLKRFAEELVRCAQEMQE
jgi:DNA-binding transcriptional LysR family regulator